MLKAIIGIALLAGAFAGCAGEETGGTVSAPEGQDDPDSGSTPEPSEAPDNSRETPAGIGTAIEVGGWVIVVNSITPLANDIVAAENQFNSPPATGTQFFIANLSATYTGSDESASLLIDLSYSALGPSNVEYQDFSASCGVIPAELDVFTEVFQGGTITGNVCWAISTADVAELTMFVEESFTLDQDRVWLSLH